MENEYIQQILKENRDLKQVNIYNQSLIKIFKEWIRSINGVEKIISKTDVQRFSIDFDNLAPNILTVHRIDFPTLHYIESRPNDLLEKLLYASEIKNDCEVCNMAKNNLIIYGFKANFCPKCGKLL